MQLHITSRVGHRESSSARDDYFRHLAHHLRIGSYHTHRAGRTLLVPLVRRLDDTVDHPGDEYTRNLHLYRHGDRFEYPALLGRVGAVYDPRLSAASCSDHYGQRTHRSL